MYQKLKENEVRFEEFMTDDATLILTAFGSVARIAKTAIMMAREEGLKVGLFRPITLFPFPTLSSRLFPADVKNFSMWN